VNLLIDPDLLAADANSVGRPNAYISRHGATTTTFGYYPADQQTGPSCGRCNELLHDHLWQFVDGDEVIDCGRRPSTTGLVS
jgi:hypothetical protein